MNNSNHVDDNHDEKAWMKLQILKNSHVKDDENMNNSNHVDDNHDEKAWMKL